MSSLDLRGGASPAVGRLATRVIVVCWFLVLLDGLDLFVYGAVLPGVFDDKAFHLSKAAGGDIGSFTNLGMLLGALTAGLLNDRIGRRLPLMAGVTIFALASAGAAAAHTVTVFGVARFISGYGLGALLPTCLALVQEFAPKARKNLAVTFVMTAHQAGGALAGGLALSVVHHLGWRSVYWFGALPLLAVPLIWALLPESMTYLLGSGRTAQAKAQAAKYGVPLEFYAPEAGGEKRRGDVRQLFTRNVRSTTLLFWVASFFGLLLVYGMNTWLPTMMRGHGYNLGSAISFLLVINLGGIVGMLVAGPLADRFGPRRIALIWFTCTAIGVALLAAHTGQFLTYVIVFVTGGFLFSAQTLIYASTSTYYLPSVRATALGWVSAVGRWGSIFGPWFGGVLLSHGFDTAGFWVFAIAAAIAVVTIAFVRRNPEADAYRATEKLEEPVPA
ncbi:MFS transporter [Nocardia sp. BMG111209]|uniref:MFS transporter n=1 Tax=Nocardia sp. BMG111209 TaxID=1160137 RepID=UPI0018CAFD45|nr:MFS transporter [Nocardia sp. BMG111209]